MARYSDAELNTLKQTIDLVALIQSKGIKLEKHGKDLKGLCPFHADKNPSMIIIYRGNYLESFLKSLLKYTQIYARGPFFVCRKPAFF